MRDRSNKAMQIDLNNVNVLFDVLENSLYLDDAKPKEAVGLV